MKNKSDLRTRAGTPLFPEYARQLNFSAAACEILHAAGTWRERLERLAKRFPVDAIRLLPAMLPKRPAVWWGLLCAWEVHRENPSDKVQSALAATVRWLEDPSELHRRECEAAGNAAELATSAGCVAKAAFWSDGSMSRVGLPNVTPPAELTASLIGSSVLLAAVEKDHLQVARRYRQFMNIGLQVASGELLWSNAAMQTAATPLVELPSPPTPETRERILHWPLTGNDRVPVPASRGRRDHAASGRG